MVRTMLEKTFSNTVVEISRNRYLERVIEIEESIYIATKNKETSVRIYVGNNFVPWVKKIAKYLQEQYRVKIKYDGTKYITIEGEFSIFLTDEFMQKWQKNKILLLENEAKLEFEEVLRKLSKRAEQLHIDYSFAQNNQTTLLTKLQEKDSNLCEICFSNSEEEDKAKQEYERIIDVAISRINSSIVVDTYSLDTYCDGMLFGYIKKWLEGENVKIYISDIVKDQLINGKLIVMFTIDWKHLI